MHGGKLDRLCVLVDLIFSLYFPFGEILGKNGFVKRVTHWYFRKQKVKIGMGLILRWRSAQVIQSTVNGLNLSSNALSWVSRRNFCQG